MLAELSSDLAEQLLRIGGGMGKLAMPPFKKVEFTRGCIHLKQGGHCKKSVPMQTLELPSGKPNEPHIFVKLGTREQWLCVAVHGCKGTSCGLGRTTLLKDLQAQVNEKLSEEDTDDDIDAMTLAQ